MTFAQFINSLDAGQAIVIIILTLAILMALLEFIFFPITSRLEKIEKAIRESNANKEARK